MYLIIFDPNSKTPAILSDKDGKLAEFDNFKEAKDQAELAMYDKNAGGYMIVKECTN